MTFPIIGSECAPGILDIGPAIASGSVPLSAATTDLTRLFALDRLSPDRRFACHWIQEIDGRLACFWEPDIVLTPRR
jgi:hypothetical protein